MIVFTTIGRNTFYTNKHNYLFTNAHKYLFHKLPPIQFTNSHKEPSQGGEAG